jgi:hypothetical protein
MIEMLCFIPEDQLKGFSHLQFFLYKAVFLKAFTYNLIFKLSNHLFFLIKKRCNIFALNLI